MQNSVLFDKLKVKGSLNMKKLLSALSILLLLSACVTQSPQVPPEKPEPQTPSPQDPNDQSIVLSNMEVLSTELSNPWSLKELPDGSIIITEKGGSLKRYIENEGLVSIEFEHEDINDSGQGGLLDVLVDPQFEDNQTLYLTYSTSHTVLAKATLSKDLSKVEKLEVLYEALPSINSSNHYGGRVVMDKKGNLYLSTGDRQVTSNRMSAQDDTTGHGKVIKITPGEELISIFAKGFRNPQGLVLDSQGRLFLSDMGPKGGDEINIVIEHQNYGWPIVTQGTEYSGEIIGDGLHTLEGMIDPIYAWNPSIAPSGITFIDDNHLLVSSLVQRHLVLLTLENDEVIQEDKYLLEFGQRIRDVIVTSQNKVLVVTDEGSLVQLSLE